MENGGSKLLCALKVYDHEITYWEVYLKRSGVALPLENLHLEVYLKRSGFALLLR